MRSKRHIAPQGKEPVLLPAADAFSTSHEEERTAHLEPEPSPCAHSNGAPAPKGSKPARTPKYPCPCCGCHTLPVPAADAVAYICPVCFWENDVFLSREDEPSDENHGLTLQEARAHFKQYHACDPRFLQHVRTSGQDKENAQPTLGKASP